MSHCTCHQPHCPVCAVSTCRFAWGGRPERSLGIVRCQGLTEVLGKIIQTRVPILPAPQFSINSFGAAQNEGTSPTVQTVFTFRISRTGDLTQAVTVGWRIWLVEADAADFIGGVVPAGQVFLDAGEDHADFTIAVQPDANYEPDEHFLARIDNVSYGAIASQMVTATILNDDAFTPPQAPGLWSWHRADMGVTYSSGNAVGAASYLADVASYPAGTDLEVKVYDYFLGLITIATYTVQPSDTDPSMIRDGLVVAITNANSGYSAMGNPINADLAVVTPGWYGSVMNDVVGFLVVASNGQPGGSPTDFSDGRDGDNQLVNWLDQSGNNRHLFPAAAGYAPFLQPAALNGFPVVSNISRFGKLKTIGNGPSFDNGGAIYIVAKQQRTGSVSFIDENGVFVASGDTGRALLCRGLVNDSVRGGMAQPPVSMATLNGVDDSAYHTYFLGAEAGYMFIGADGGANDVLRSLVGGVPAAHPLTLFYSPVGYAIGNKMIAEVLVYDQPHDPAMRTLVWNYLRNKYAHY